MFLLLVLLGTVFVLSCYYNRKHEVRRKNIIPYQETKAPKEQSKKKLCKNVNNGHLECRINKHLQRECECIF